MAATGFTSFDLERRTAIKVLLSRRYILYAKCYKLLKSQQTGVRLLFSTTMLASDFKMLLSY
jgi:hypothetical protein